MTAGPAYDNSSVRSSYSNSSPNLKAEKLMTNVKNQSDQNHHSKNKFDSGISLQRSDTMATQQLDTMSMINGSLTYRKHGSLADLFTPTSTSNSRNQAASSLVESRVKGIPLERDSDVSQLQYRPISCESQVRASADMQDYYDTIIEPVVSTGDPNNSKDFKCNCRERILHAHANLLTGGKNYKSTIQESGASANAGSRNRRNSIQKSMSFATESSYSRMSPLIPPSTNASNSYTRPASATVSARPASATVSSTVTTSPAASPEAVRVTLPTPHTFKGKSSPVKPFYPASNYAGPSIPFAFSKNDHSCINHKLSSPILSPLAPLSRYKNDNQHLLAVRQQHHRNASYSSQ